MTTLARPPVFRPWLWPWSWLPQFAGRITQESLGRQVPRPQARSPAAEAPPWPSLLTAPSRSARPEPRLRPRGQAVSVAAVSSGLSACVDARRCPYSVGNEAGIP